MDSEFEVEDVWLEWAEKIYLHYYGHLDDKRFQAKKITEIYDWLYEGDTSSSPSLQKCIDEWGEYDADEIEAQND